MNAVETIEKATGLKPGTMDGIWQEVQANKKKLESCSRPHDFSICLDRRTKQPIEGEPTPGQRFGAYWRCAKCGGQFPTIDKLRYEEGLKDGQRPQPDPVKQ